MKDKSTKSNGKKPIFKKWWFWVIIVVILAAIFGNTGAKDGVEDLSLIHISEPTRRS